MALKGKTGQPGLETELHKFLNKAKFRLFRQNFLRVFSFYAFFGVWAAFIFSVIELFVPFYYAGIFEAGFLVMSAVCAFIHCLAIFPSDKEAAMYVDGTGLKERLTTSVELFGRDDEFSVLQRADTWDNVKDFSFKFRLPFNWYLKRYIGVLALLFVVCVCILMPSDAKNMAKTVHEFAKLEGSEEEKIDKALDELKKKKDEGKISGEKYEELKKALEDAREQISESESKRDVEKAKERLAKKVRDSLDDRMEKELVDAMQSLAGKYNLSELAEYQKQLSELAAKSEEFAKYQNGLKDLGDMMSDGERQALLNELKKRLEDGELTPQELKDALNATGNANAQVAASSLDENVTGMDGNNGQDGSNGGNANSNNGSNGNNGNNAESTNGKGNKSANGGGNKGGAAAGKGNGKGNGAGGNGTGLGGQNGQRGYNTGSANGHEQKDDGSSGEDVTVTGKKKGSDGNLTGNKNGDGGKSGGKTTGTGWEGSKVGLDSVIGQYKDEAYSKIGNNEIPAGMDSVVKEYFGGLAGE